jgi:hypothetical protein
VAIHATSAGIASGDTELLFGILDGIGRESQAILIARAEDVVLVDSTAMSPMKSHAL